MRRTRGRMLLLAGVLASLLGASGCTGTDRITAGNGGVSARVDLAGGNGRFLTMIANHPPGAPAGDEASISISQISVLPQDPAALAALQEVNAQTGEVTQITTGLLLESITPSPDFRINPTVTRSVPLSAGSYRLVGIRIDRMRIRDCTPSVNNLPVNSCRQINPSGDFIVDPANIGTPGCRDFRFRYEATSAFNILLCAGTDCDPGEVDFGQPITFRVEPNGFASLGIRFDFDALLAALEASTPCSASCPCPAQYDPGNPATHRCSCDGNNATNINFDTLVSLAPTYLSFS